MPTVRKRFGQHFLTDPNIVRKIVTLAAIQPEETVLEIGPGRGALTSRLCERAARVIAIELDRDLHRELSERLSGCANLELQCGDALAFPYDTLPNGTVAVSNLPYYISTPLLFALLEAGTKFNRLILMLQTEVARRVAAAPGSREYGVLSVLAQAVANVKVAFAVAATCFQPPPDVGSSVVRLAIPPRAPVAIHDHALFARVVRAAFAHRRKTLLNSLRDEGFEAAAIQHALERAGIAAARRAETLSVEDFARLAAAFPA